MKEINNFFEIEVQLKDQSFRMVQTFRPLKGQTLKQCQKQASDEVRRLRLVKPQDKLRLVQNVPVD